MRFKISSCAALFAISWWRIAAAQIPVAGQTPVDLPSTELAREWLSQDAEVIVAEAGRSAATYEARQLRASPNEWSARYTWQKRSYEMTQGPDSREWIAQLERPIRLPNKWYIDRGLANTALDLGDARFGETLHESARDLVDIWLGSQETRELEQLFDAQVGVAEQNFESVAARLRSGEAARLDLNLGEADLADVKRRRSEAVAARTRAELAFHARFSGQLPSNPRRVDPEPVGGTLESWKERILAQSDELRIAELEAERARANASRARADQLPDPSIGLYTASEVFDNERVTGISVTIPLPGRYRVARASQAGLEARAAQARLAGVRREMDARIAATFAEAQGSYERWTLAQTAAQKADETAALTRRAYELGETDIQALILARRQALDASVNAVQARVQARRASAHLLVDAHLIWDLDHE